ncbi:hypothetical protein [Synechococcus sp. H65.1]|uniref:hypothetical protein n=1 Tax=unclassified Synechococcus TaxID=2626047 RepID=UPI0039C29DD6
MDGLVYDELDQSQAHLPQRQPPRLHLLIVGLEALSLLPGLLAPPGCLGSAGGLTFGCLFPRRAHRGHRAGNPSLGAVAA